MSSIVSDLLECYRSAPIEAARALTDEGADGYTRAHALRRMAHITADVSLAVLCEHAIRPIPRDPDAYAAWALAVRQVAAELRSRGDRLS